MLHYFRQNSKIILAIFGVILILTWLIIPAITDMMQNNGNSQADPLVVSWKGGRLTQSEMRHLRIVHRATLTFLGSVIAETQQRQGIPRAPGYERLDPRRGIVGINPSTSDQALLTTQLLARRARELGVVVTDETVMQFLMKVSDYMLKEPDFANLVAAAVPRAETQVTQGAIFEHLKTELLAQQMQLMAQAGVNSMTPGDFIGAGLDQGRHGLLPPGEMWQLYERFNRRVKVEAFPLKVSDFVDKVTSKPTDAELLKLFEEGRMRTPDPEFPESGFRQPHRLAFEYIKVDNAPFLEAAKKEITDEQIAAEYEKGKATGNFKVEEKPADPATPAEAPADPSKPADPAKPAEAKPADPAKPDSEKPAADKPAEDKPADANPTDKPAEKPADKPADGEQKPAAEPAKPEPKPNEGSALPRDVQLVNFQDDKAADVKPADAKAETPAAEAKPADAKPAETNPADAPADTKPADAKPADAKPADAPADAKAADAKPGEEAKPVQFKPLDEVKDQIRTQLATPIATERRKALIDKVVAAAQEYSRKYTRWRSQVERQKEAEAAKGKKDAAKKPEIVEPAPLDLAPILGEYNLKLEKIPLVDAFGLRNFDIGREAFQFNMQSFQQMPFYAVAFQDNAAFFAPQTMPFSWDNKQFAGLSNVIWVYWRTDEQKAKELDFSEARDQVEAFWKQQEALKLAQAAAENLAEAANKGKELKTVVPDPKAIVEPAPFSWMTAGALGDQFSQTSPTISAVTGVEFAGQDFMRSVFDLPVGQTGVALNQPHSVVWVVRVVSEETNLEQDRARFLEMANSPTMLLSAYREQNQLMQDLYRELIERFDVKWAPGHSDIAFDE
jgi:hypothetical protein